MTVQTYEVSLLAWGKDGVRLVGRTRDAEAVEVIRDVLRRELDSDTSVSAIPTLRVVRPDEEESR